MIKKIFPTLSFLTVAMSAYSQYEKPVLIQKPTVLKEPISALPSNLTQGKDLTIRIKTFKLDPNNGCAINLTYVVRNNGTEPLDINGVSISGLIDAPQDIPTATAPNILFNGKNYYPGCGHLLASNSTILNPGQETERSLLCSYTGLNIYYNNSSNYSYILTIDHNNAIAEANENNNTVLYSFTGHQGQYIAPAPASQYYLTDAFVIVNTGADNKEMESEVNFRLIPSQSKNLVANNQNEFVKKIVKNELPFFTNSSSTLPLNLYMASTYRIVNPPTSLEAFKQNGLGFLIEYKPNLITDAWKIDKIQLVLCFKDANGIYHPTEGRKTITFNMPANTFLDGFFKHFLACKADASFNPVGVRVLGRLSDF